jgi:hypothetical protein
MKIKILCCVLILFCFLQKATAQHPIAPNFLGINLHQTYYVGDSIRYGRVDPDGLLSSRVQATAPKFIRKGGISYDRENPITFTTFQFPSGQNYYKRITDSILNIGAKPIFQLSMLLDSFNHYPVSSHIQFLRWLENTYNFDTLHIALGNEPDGKYFKILAGGVRQVYNAANIAEYFINYIPTLRDSISTPLVVWGQI